MDCDGSPRSLGVKESKKQDYVELSGFNSCGQPDKNQPKPANSKPMTMVTGLAIFIQYLFVSYNAGKPVLKNLSMRVEEGTIYTLLGDSGCGKSTLLNTIVGLKGADSGDVFVLKKRVNDVPGRCVGFMPQDIALYDQLSIVETMRYYGKLNGMSAKKIQEQTEWLIKFLQLPSRYQLVKNLSGGMRRRCSLAVTLIHQPKLVILDEPTVGLDPLLRESIWEYLHEAAKTTKLTVLVTTHYLEEAKYANTIGIMRKGRLIAENSPQSLLQKCNSQLLQEVVLKLCHEDEMNLACSDNYKKKPDICACSEQKSKYLPMEAKEDRKSKPKNHGFISANRIYAFSTVLWLTLLRHPVVLGIILFIPTTQMLISLLVVGTDPRDLKFGVVNDDNAHCFGKERNHLATFEQQLNRSSCDLSELSCKFIGKLSESTVMTLISTPTETEAIARVESGELWGYFYFPHNYSMYLENFMIQRVYSDNATLDGSRVSLRLDMSNYVASLMAIRASYLAYMDFSGGAARPCGMDSREVLPPLHFREPVFQKRPYSSPTYRDFVTPIILHTIIFEVPIFVTAILIINDLKQGTMDRTRVAGLRFYEIMASHLLTQGCVAICQTLICTFIMSVGFNFAIKGSIVLYFLIMLLVGLFGTSLGIFLGVFLVEEFEALVVIIFVVFSCLCYEGGIWPVDGMLPSVRFISKYLFPSTLVIESLRSVIYRGVGLFHSMVWPGIAVFVTWTVAIILLSIIVTVTKIK